MQEQNQSSLEEELSNFVLAYYRSAAYRGETEINKYYAPSARIWRDSMDIVGKEVNQFIEKNEPIFPILEIGDKLAIQSFHGLSLPHGFNLYVEGIISIEEDVQEFKQSFTIYEIQERFFIYSDHLTLSSVNLDTTKLNSIYQNLSIQIPFKHNPNHKKK